MLADTGAYNQLRAAALETIVQHYALDRCLPGQMALLDSIVDGRLLDRASRAA